MSNAYKPTREEAIDYLENCCYWEVLEVVDPEGVLDPWDLDEAMLAWALDYLTQYYSKNVLRPDSE